MVPVRAGEPGETHPYKWGDLSGTSRRLETQKGLRYDEGIEGHRRR
jgi:hypothetical protein